MLNSENEILADFHEDYVKLQTKSEFGGFALDNKGLRLLVRKNPKGARLFVEYLCSEAKSTPGYLDHASVIAVHYSVEFNDSSLQNMVNLRSDELGL